MWPASSKEVLQVSGRVVLQQVRMWVYFLYVTFIPVHMMNRTGNGIRKRKGKIKLNIV